MRIPKVGWHNVQGYAMIYTPDKRQMQRSRYVMEQLLGRKLRSDEIVHHVNHKKDDDRPKNLMLTTSGDHHRIFHRHLNIPIDELVKAYESGVSAVKLARTYETDPKTIRRWIHVYAGKTIRSQAEANRLSGVQKREKVIDEEVAVYLHDCGYGTKTIAKFFQLPFATMRYILKRIVPMRDCQSAQNVRTFFRSPSRQELLQKVEQWRNREAREKALLEIPYPLDTP